MYLYLDNLYASLYIHKHITHTYTCVVYLYVALSQHVFFGLQTVVLKVFIHCEQCQKQVKKVLKKLDGRVTSCSYFLSIN